MSAAPYVTPDGAYSATYPGFWRRFAAGAVDWILCYVLYLLVSIPLGMVQAAARTSWEAGDLGGLPGEIVFRLAQVLIVVPIVAYFALFWQTGSTLGMRALDIELLCARTGKQPGLVRAAARALFALAHGGATYIVFFVTVSDPPAGGYSSTDRAITVVAFAVYVVGGLGKLWMFVDSRRQTAWDRLFGLLYVENVTPTVPTETSRWELWLSHRVQ